MRRDKDLSSLQELARLMLDHRLTQLREAAARREQSRMQISALDRSAEPTDLPPTSAERVALRYQLWADGRRTELTSVLARQTADWLDARQDATMAFGRAEALRGLAPRLDRRR